MPSNEPKYNGTKADELIKQYESHLGNRRNIESYWQTLHDYFYVESAEVNRTYTAGSELEFSQLWDSTTLECADVFASGFMNYLTPPTAKWARLRHRNPTLSENTTLAKYFEDVMDEVNAALERSNFYETMYPTYKSSGVYGTALLFEEEDITDDIRFQSIPLKQCVIVDDVYGRIGKYFIEFEYTANQAAQRWGREKLKSEMQREITEGKGDLNKHKFVLYIAQRHDYDETKTDKRNMPIEASWIDIQGKSVIEESGYNEMPAFTHRFDKRPLMAWGFSPAMKALPFARILQVAAKTNMRAMMKNTDPPIALPSNAFIAPFNMNPRAINYYRKDKMDGRDIFPFGNFGDPQTGLTAIEFYAQKVKSMMYTDVFLAFNQITKDMNNPEIMERINEKMTMLGPAVGRYLDEVISPVIQRTIGILFRRGKLPEPPPELIENPSYKIDFVGRLAMAQRSTELQALMTSLGMIGQVAQFNPEVLDNIDADKVTDEVFSITGAPVAVLRDDAEVQKIREGRAEQSMQQAELAQAQVVGQVAKDAGAAQKSFSDAQKSK